MNHLKPYQIYEKKIYYPKEITENEYSNKLEGDLSNYSFTISEISHIKNLVGDKFIVVCNGCLKDPSHIEDCTSGNSYDIGVESINVEYRYFALVITKLNDEWFLVYELKNIKSISVGMWPSAGEKYYIADQIEEVLGLLKSGINFMKKI